MLFPFFFVLFSVFLPFVGAKVQIKLDSSKQYLNKYKFSSPFYFSNKNCPLGECMQHSTKYAYSSIHRMPVSMYLYRLSETPAYCENVDNIVF